MSLPDLDISDNRPDGYIKDEKIRIMYKEENKK